MNQKVDLDDLKQVACVAIIYSVCLIGWAAILYCLVWLALAV